MDYTLTKILPHVYHLHFEDHYQLAMTFLRAQEFYESPEFADKFFTLVDFMEWYVDEYGRGAFTYSLDWSGFNCPSWVFEKLHLRRDYLNAIPDYNKYDKFMRGIALKIKNLEGEHLWYLIGTSSAGHKNDGQEEDVLDHEIAHALYYTNKEYNFAVERLLRQINALHDVPGKASSRYRLAHKCLEKAGYHERTIRDEIHAYASTGANTLGLEEFLTPEVCKPFEDNFKRYKDLLIPRPKI